MAEAIHNREADVFQEITPSAGYTSGEVIQLADGRAGYITSLTALTTGMAAGLQTTGIATVAKTTSQVWVKGAPIYWDRSAGTATPLLALAGGDFFLGTAADDATSSATTGEVNLNVKPEYQIDLLKDRCTSVATGSTPTLTVLPGGSLKFLIANTSEAECIDALSDKSFLVTQPFVLEGRINIVANGDATVDINVGIADGTSTTDADAITTSCFIHVDGNALHINAESDNAVAEVAATDTTADYAEGTPFDFVLDGRTPSDIQLYINAVQYLASSVFTIAGATGPMKLLVHLEKSSGTEIPQVIVEKLAVRLMDVAN